VKIRVDMDLCQGHGVCAGEAPELFKLDESTSKVIVLDPAPPESLRTKLTAAAKYCPTRAIKILEE
jgi:ferredoxin